MEKQTAVEWLRKELETIPNYSAFYTNNYQWIDSIINEAKEMEKEQIIKVFIDVSKANCEAFKLPFTSKDKQDFKVIAETYYNETFKSE